MAQMDIERALFAAFATLGYSYVSYPNGPKVTPAATDLNYSVSVMYAPAHAAGTGASAYDRYTGIFQALVRCPLIDSVGNPAGTYAGATQAEVIKAKFKRGASFYYPATGDATYVHCKTPTIEHLGNLDGAWYTIAVSVPWWADVLP